MTEQTANPCGRLARFTVPINGREVEVRFTFGVMKDFRAKTGRSFMDTSWMDDEEAAATALLLAAAAAGSELSDADLVARDIDEVVVTSARFANMFAALQAETFEGNLSAATKVAIQQALVGRKVGEKPETPNELSVDSL